MAGRALVDTGFLVALLDGNDEHHAWARALLPSLPGPWLTAEACISETIFLLERAGRAPVQALVRWLRDGLLHSTHALPERLGEVTEELFGHEPRWVDFADACVVALSDEHPRLPVVSVEHRDFRAYFRRRRGRKLLTPG